ncbi:PREDICTED: arf-GAP with coiled-coil, ANK repeat and PH domain-containing protein 3, partial [Myotis brandtii]|uniref:arf-GAP with coiled-coil, ANK repeat and PH domain-containing protein 3 n=1 Tax=Myotis brandtii TaxID=109478 RepID=UPI000703E749
PLYPGPQQPDPRGGGPIGQGLFLPGVVWLWAALESAGSGSLSCLLLPGGGLSQLPFPGLSEGRGAAGQPTGASSPGPAAPWGGAWGGEGPACLTRGQGSWLQADPWPTSSHCRATIDEVETDVVEIEAKLDKLVKLCSGMIEAGKAYVTTNRLFVSGVRDLSQQCQGDTVISECLQRFGDSLQEMVNYHMILFDQAQRSVRQQLHNFIKEDVRKFKETKKQFDKVREDLELSLVRNAQAPRHRPHEVEEATGALTLTRKCFRHLALDYVLQINVLQAKKKFEILDSMLSFMHAQYSFFQQGYSLLHQLDPYMKKLAAELDQLVIDSAVEKREMEHRHAAIQQRTLLQDFSYDEPKAEFDVDAPSGVVMEGYLFKRASNAFKTWNRRWFSIQNSQLVYQKKLKDVLTVVVDDLRLCSVKPCEDIERRVQACAGASGWGGGAAAGGAKAGARRGLGVHCSKVRSLTLDSWEPELLKLMCELGNSTVNQIYEAQCEGPGSKKPTASSPRQDKEAWIKDKYVEKKFLRKPPHMHWPQGGLSTHSLTRPPSCGLTCLRAGAHGPARGLFCPLSSHPRRPPPAPGAPLEDGWGLGRSRGDSGPPLPTDPAGLSSDSGLGGSSDGSSDVLAFGVGSVVDSVAEEGGCHASPGSLIVCEFLLQNGADVNQRDSRGRAPLHHATLLGPLGGSSPTELQYRRCIQEFISLHLEES